MERQAARQTSWPMMHLHRAQALALILVFASHTAKAFAATSNYLNKWPELKSRKLRCNTPGQNVMVFAMVSKKTINPWLMVRMKVSALSASATSSVGSAAS